mmetsp:Transcript_38077/g.91098  ORF Transcript_38077/g.91098 Transcript_38077/m.91098 type:complete len:222 (-) Transcript_38077:560-1225(-)
MLSVDRIGIRDTQAQAKVDEDDVALVVEVQVPQRQVAVTHSLLLKMRHRRQDLNEPRPRDGLVRQTGRRERHLVKEGGQQVAPRHVREDEVKVSLGLEGVGECDDVPVPPSEKLVGRALLHWILEMTTSEVLKSADLDGNEVVRCDPRRAHSRVAGVVFRPPQDGAEPDASVGRAAELPSDAISLLGKLAGSIAGREVVVCPPRLTPSRSARRRLIERGIP